jgi:small-conductance mechanosensitive channel
MNHFGLTERWLVPALFIAGGLLLGVAFRTMALRKIRRMFERKSLIPDTAVVKPLGRLILVGFFLAGLSGALQNYPLSPEWARVMRQAIIVAMILAATLSGAQIAAHYVDVFSSKREGLLPGISIIKHLARVMVFIVGLLIILQQLGISVAPLLATLGVGGLAVALALQDTLSNLFSGLQILLSRQIKQGDYIQLESGDRGYVTDISLRNTTVRGLGGSLIILPNSKLATTSIVNFDLPQPESAVLVNVGVDYDSDLARVEEVTLDVARGTLKEVPGGVDDYEPLVRFNRLGDFSIDLTVVLRARTYTDRYLLTHEFIKRLCERYRKEGIVIPFPVRSVRLRNE